MDRFDEAIETIKKDTDYEKVKEWLENETESLSQKRVL